VREGDKEHVAEDYDTYLGNTIKQIVLYFAADEYEDTLSRLKEIMAATGLESHTAVILKLLEHYEQTLSN
jgi:hypothetical protein